MMPLHSLRSTPRAAGLLRVALLCVLGAGVSGTAVADGRMVPLPAEKLRVAARGGPELQRFAFRTRSRSVATVPHHPRRDGFAFIVNGEAALDTSSGLIELDRLRWKRLRDERGRAVGWRYLDRSGSRGGVTRVVLLPGKLIIKARGAGWPWAPPTPQDAVWLHVLIGEDVYCARFGSDSRVAANEAGVFRARDAESPVACASQLCGNGVIEPGEECDDGNGEPADGCDTSCRLSTCDVAVAESTYEAIQLAVWDEPQLGCSTAACHGALAQGGLDLRGLGSYDELVSAPSLFGGLRVAPGIPQASVLYRKLAARTLGEPIPGLGSGMPLTGSAVAEDTLEAIRLWIAADAPRQAVVPGTGELLGICLPPAP